MSEAHITAARRAFFKRLNAEVHLQTPSGQLTNADDDSAQSVKIAQAIARRVGAGTAVKKPSGQTLGGLFENIVGAFLGDSFPRLSALRPGKWVFPASSGRQGQSGFGFEQYAHLKELSDLVRTQRRVRASLGNDYVISPDIVLVREPLTDAEINANGILVDGIAGTRASIRKDFGGLPFLQACISCKWTLRSDRAQNARSEALNLIRNRKGRAPHIVVVTAEPTPSRIASLALGTGDIDCVYHFALPELIESVEELGYEDAQELLAVMVDGKRLKDISDLPLDLAL
jgi:hypothetical protein